MNTLSFLCRSVAANSELQADRHFSLLDERGIHIAPEVCSMLRDIAFER